MHKNMKKTALAILLLFIVGCGWSKGDADVSAHNLPSVPSTPKVIKVSDEEAKSLVASGAVLLDVRTLDEFNEEHIPKAIHLPYDLIDANAAARNIKSLDTPIVVYCRSGRRSDVAAKTLLSLGYTAVYDLGARSKWK